MEAVEALKRYLFVSSGKERFDLRPADEAAILGVLTGITEHPKARA